MLWDLEVLCFFYQERLEFVMEQIFHHSSSKELQNKLLKRKKKREWIQRKKARNRKEVTDLLAKREELSKIIDDQREVAKTREFSLIKVKRNETKMFQSSNFLFTHSRMKRNGVRLMHFWVKSAANKAKLNACNNFFSLLKICVVYEHAPWKPAVLCSLVKKILRVLRT